MDDKKLAPGLKGSTFQEVSAMLEKILQKETAETPKEMAILSHGLALAEWYLADSDERRDAKNKLFKTSEEILQGLGFTFEEIVAINVFFRKRRDVLEELKREIEKKIKEGVRTKCRN